MYFKLIINYLTNDIRATVVSIIIGVIIYYISKFYLKVWSLPPGPIPLPFVGNILYFRGTKRHSSIEIIELSKKYGPVFTFWFGPKPYIVITDRDIARETFRRNEFSGRPRFFFGSFLSNDNYTDVVFADYGHEWEALRRVAHSAVRKYANTEKLALLVSDVVDHTVETLIKKEGTNKPFDSSNYIYLTFLNIMAASAFGKRYDIEDKEFLKLKYTLNDYIKELGSRVVIWEFIPLMRLVDRKLLNIQLNNFEWMRNLTEVKYKNHYKDFDETVIRDFSDALISAKNEALVEGKESAVYLSDKNLAMVALDLFLAGTQTSHDTMVWILKLLAFYPEIQNKLRQEIETEIGDRMPTQEDRNRCHYTNAYISETMRMKNITPFGVFHNSVVQSKIGDLTIPEKTGIIVHQYSIMNDEKYWEKPNQFLPERFLENGKYVSPLPSAFIPFSVGRRVCLGEKLALADLFLVLVRLLQKTNGYEIVLEGGPENNDIEPDINAVDGFFPNEHKLILKA